MAKSITKTNRPRLTLDFPDARDVDIGAHARISPIIPHAERLRVARTTPRWRRRR